MTQWHCLAIETGREEYVGEKLEVLSLEAYSPECIHRSRRGKLSTKVRPLWPGYMLARGAMGALWEAPRSVYGVYGVLCRPGAPDSPAPLPDSLIADLRARENAAGVIEVQSKRLERWRRQQLVKLRRDDFGGLVGQVEAEDKDGLVSVWLSFLGGTRLVEGFRSEQLEAVA